MTAMTALLLAAFVGGCKVENMGIEGSCPSTGIWGNLKSDKFPNFGINLMLVLLFFIINT